MTRKFNLFYRCEHCGQRSSVETGFGRWMRNSPRLDSAEGIVRTDIDHIILRYKTYLEGRGFQLMMIVEVKVQNRYCRLHALARCWHELGRAILVDGDNPYTRGTDHLSSEAIQLNQETM